MKDFKADDSNKTFTISEIDFNKPIQDAGLVWQPYEYQDYVLHIRHIESLVILVPPGAKGISGNILSKKK